MEKVRLKRRYQGMKENAELSRTNHGNAGVVFGDKRGNNWYTIEFVKNHPELFEVVE